MTDITLKPSLSFIVFFQKNGSCNKYRLHPVVIKIKI